MNDERKLALNNLKTARGQLDGIIHMIEDDRYCVDISNQILACIALLKKANLHILTGHMNTCVKHAVEDQEHVEEKLKEIEALLAKIMK